MSDYLPILQALRELPFNVGKGTLLELLQGRVTKRMVSNDIYMELEAYGSMQDVSSSKIEAWIRKLVQHQCVSVVHPPDKPFWKLLQITQKGLQELSSPSISGPEFSRTYTSAKASAKAKILLNEFSSQLAKFNEEQRHAIVAPENKVLCVAGAGTGKTTVLTQRIRFLTTYRGVKPQNILAITFTRKAREEMQKRLAGIPVRITTFNGFCQHVLQRHGRGKPIATFGQKVKLFRDAVKAQDISVEQLLRDYYTPQQRKDKTHEELSRRLMIDVYSIVDHYSNEDTHIPSTGRTVLATTLLKIASTIQDSMKKKELRDYSDQLRDTLALFRSQPETIPQYTHILVDEYQDVNTAQVALLDLLSPEHLFVVGDPRQSIFGWRGSQVGFIRDFAADTVVQLRRNYRSHTDIISLMNQQIEVMQLPSLVSHSEQAGTVQMLKYDSEVSELRAVAMLLSHTNHTDIFVLARTNRQLEDLSSLLSENRVKHSIRTEEDVEHSGIVLSTVHAIKGLEARTVIVMGCSNRYFPCKVSDHPVIDLIKEYDLDREEEERRLLYVALSRAKEHLIVTHAGTQTYLLGTEKKEKQTTLPKPARDDSLFAKLKGWRSETAKQRGLPAYCILSDKTLRHISDTKPQTNEQLQLIHGMGETKISQFGDDILELVSG